MDETNQILDFFSSFQMLACDPGTYKLDHASLDHKFDSLLEKEFRSATSNSLADQSFQNPVTFAIFGLEKDNSTSPANSKSSHRLRVCAPQTDELLQGWLGRMHAINCLPPNSDLDHLIGQMAKLLNPEIDDRNFIECTAVVVGMSQDELLRHHTLAPFFKALVGLKPSKLGNKSLRHREAYEKQAPFKLGGKYLRCCKDCADEDFANLGYSYWRRAHQLPGILWCHEHGSQLSIHPKGVSSKNPHQLAHNNTNSQILSLSQPQIKILKNYAQIACTILNHELAIDSTVASIALGNQAKGNNFRISKPGKRPTPSSRLIECLPHWWLLEAYPRANLKPDSYIWVIDGACTPKAGRYTVTTLCLLASLFYENVNEAIDELLQPYVTSNKARGFDFWASKEILDEYIAQKGVVSRVAEKLALPPSTVGVGLLNQGLPGLGKSSSIVKAVNAFLNGQSMQQACMTHKASIKDTEAFMRTCCARVKPALNALSSPPSDSKHLSKFEKRLEASG